MGDMPSTPTEKTAEQPTALILGLNIPEGGKAEIFSAKNKKTPLVTLTDSLPFEFKNSSSLVTCKDFQLGEKYILKVGKKSHTFTFDKSFITVGERKQEEFGGGFPGGPGGFPGGFGGPGGGQGFGGPGFGGPGGGQGGFGGGR